MELEPSPGNFEPVMDLRPLIPEPLPVKLLAIADVSLHAATGMERELDGFYLRMLGFEREAAGDGTIIYRAENFRLHFDVREPPFQRDDMRAVGIEVRNLADMERQLIEAELEYSRQRGLLAGQDALTLQDPAGNWVSLVESRPV